MKKNIMLAVLAIILVLQYLGLVPGLTNQDIADAIYSGVTGQEPVLLQKQED